MKENYTTALIKLIESPELLRESPKYGQILLEQVQNEKYQFEKYIHKGMEGVIVLARDSQNLRDVIFKFAIPKLDIKRNFWNKFEEVPFFRQRKKSEIKETETSKRFIRSCYIQQQLGEIIRNENLFLYGNVPLLYGIGKEQYLYAEMEYIIGEELISWCLEKKDSVIIELYYKILMLIEKAFHAKGYIHSDLKPSAIIVRNGYPVIIDFGLSKNLKVDYLVTKKNQAMGTLPFAPKNQLQNFANRDYKCDIFALGVILYYMFLRKTPESWIETQHITNFYKLHHIKHIDKTAIRYVFQRAIRIGYPYLSISEMRKDFEKRVLKEEKKIVFNVKILKKIVNVWEETFPERK